MTDSPDMTESDRLCLAIGRVTAQSALNDEHLRTITQDLLKLSQSAWLLVEGQSTEWLCSTLPLVLDHEDPIHQRWPMKMHEALLSAVATIKSLQVHRNTIVHSTWMKGPIPRDADTMPRPWGSQDGETAWAAFRSRPRKYAPHSEWAISDIDLLAEKMSVAGAQAMAAYAKMYMLSSPQLFAGTDWYSWLQNEA